MLIILYLWLLLCYKKLLLQTISYYNFVITYNSVFDSINAIDRNMRFYPDMRS